MNLPDLKFFISQNSNHADCFNLICSLKYSHLTAKCFTVNAKYYKYSNFGCKYVRNAKVGLVRPETKFKLFRKSKDS